MAILSAYIISDCRCVTITDRQINSFSMPRPGHCVECFVLKCRNSYFGENETHAIAITQRLPTVSTLHYIGTMPEPARCVISTLNSGHWQTPNESSHWAMKWDYNWLNDFASDQFTTERAISNRILYPGPSPDTPSSVCIPAEVMNWRQTR